MLGRFYRRWRRRVTGFICKELGCNNQPLFKNYTSKMQWCSRCWTVTDAPIPVEESEDEC